MTEASAGRGPIVIWNPAAGRKVGLPTNVDLDEAGVRALFAAGRPRDRALPHRVRGRGRERRSSGSSRPATGGRSWPRAATGRSARSPGALLELGGDDPAAVPPLGILPLGSVMNVARSLDIPRELEGAVRVIAEGHERSIDVGEVVGWGPFLEAVAVGLHAELFAEAAALDAGDARRRSARSGRRSATSRRA